MGTAADDDAAATDDDVMLPAGAAEEAAGCNGAPHLDCFPDMVGLFWVVFGCRRSVSGRLVAFSGFSVCGLPSPAKYSMISNDDEVWD